MKPIFFVFLITVYLCFNLYKSLTIAFFGVKLWLGRLNPLYRLRVEASFGLSTAKTVQNLISLRRLMDSMFNSMP